MATSLKSFVLHIQTKPDTIEFADVMSVIEQNYEYTETVFTNGDIENQAGQNAGSCKIFAFAQLNQLTEAQTLACFGSYYRKDVLQHPNGDDHGNIRNFIKYGWSGVTFAQPALLAKLS